ncbi:MAG: LysR family transcriptional regulator [Pseudomonadota bacterium]
MLSRLLLQTDLNLLLALQVLLEERNITRAAERLGVSQPALNKTLQKLRETFADELFTRTEEGLVPTPRTEQLAKGLPEALEQLDTVLQPDAFDPASFDGAFRLAMPPMFTEVLLPGLMTTLAERAPNVRIISGDVGIDFQEKLKLGEIDFAIAVIERTDTDVHAEPLRTISPRCYLRKKHPLIKKTITLKDFLAYPHVRLYLPGLGRENLGLVDEVLAERGLYRNVILETTQFAPAVGVLANTDSILIANAGLAKSPAVAGTVEVQPIPDELARLFAGHSGGKRTRLALVRHTRTSNSEPHQWLRKLLVEILSEQETVA